MNFSFHNIFFIVVTNKTEQVNIKAIMTCWFKLIAILIIKIFTLTNFTFRLWFTKSILYWCQHMASISICIT